jgi:hypothetical protein
MATDLEKLIDAARLHDFTRVEREEQRKSFAYGNTKIENPRVTWEMVEREASELEREQLEK